MKIGYLQFAPCFGDLSRTIQKIEKLKSQINTADLIVLPELCNSGYNFGSHEKASNLSEVIGKSEFIDFLESICSSANLFIVAGFNERDGDDLFNSSVLIGPQGYIGKYRKLHLFLNEKNYFKPGNLGLPVFDIGNCKIGMQICFDWIFPEAWRVLALEGAHIICHPSNLVLPGFAQKAIPGHALTNRIFVITSNRIGKEDELTFTGLSTIADPNGDILVQAGQNEETAHIIEIDLKLAETKNMTPRNHIFSDRRPGEYKKLTEL